MSADPQTLADLFFPKRDSDDLPGELPEDSEEWNELKGSLKKELPKVAWGVVAKEIRAKLVQVLGVPIDQVWAPGWQKFKALQEYRDPVKHPPGESALVPLAEHTIGSHHGPHIEIVVRDIQLASIDLEVDVEMHLEGVLLKIEDARIREAHGGSCRAKGTLQASLSTKWGVKNLLDISQETPTFQLPKHLDFGEGFEIPDMAAAMEALEEPAADDGPA